jgi:hypothetical protein
VDRYPVSSSSIVSIGYDDAAAVLEVEFKQGRVYQYLDVPRGHFDGIMSAGSPGGYLNDNVKPYFRYLTV